MATMMQALAKGEQGIGSIALRETAIPAPAPGEALVRLKADTRNCRDWLFLIGELPGLTKQPGHVPLSCGAGEAIAVGEFLMGRGPSRRPAAGPYLGRQP